jgi:cytochrome c553
LKVKEVGDSSSSTAPRNGGEGEFFNILSDVTLGSQLRVKGRILGMSLFRGIRVQVSGLALLGMVAAVLLAAGMLRAQEGADDIYNHKCAVCHGKDGLGNTVKGKKVHVKDVHANMKDSEAEMIKAVTNGKGDDMDSYKKEYSSDQIKELVEYYRTLGERAAVPQK